MTILKDKNLITRTEHRCLFCRRMFPIGTPMHYQVNVIEGQLCNIYSCVTCEAIIKIVPDDNNEYCEGYVHEMLGKGQTPEALLEELKMKNK